MPNMDNHDDHERFTRLLLESEPVMLRSIQVAPPNRAEAREIMQLAANSRNMSIRELAAQAWRPALEEVEERLSNREISTNLN